LESFNVTVAVATSAWHNVATVTAALFSTVQVDPAAGVITIVLLEIVAGTTVTATAELAPAESETVNVTTVLANTFFGVNVNEAPTTGEVTGTVVGSLEVTLNGPTPPEMPTVLGVLPNALNADGLAESVLAVGVGVEDDDPPQPANAAHSATPHAAIDNLPSKPKEFLCVRVRAISSTSAFVKSRKRVYLVKKHPLDGERQCPLALVQMPVPVFGFPERQSCRDPAKCRREVDVRCKRACVRKQPTGKLEIQLLASNDQWGAFFRGFPRQSTCVKTFT
jgi:hypothetical protein